MHPIDTIKIEKMKDPGVGASPAPANPNAKKNIPVRIAL
jgi:hypothetical protein